MALEDLIQCLHSLLESDVVLRLDDHAKMHVQGAAQSSEIDLRSISANHTPLLKALHSLGDGGSRESHSPAKLGKAETGILFNQAQQRPVCRVESGFRIESHTAIKPSILRLLADYSFDWFFASTAINHSMEFMIESITKGVWLGFCIAAPVGPIGTLVLKQSLKQGRRSGLASGLGAALADLCYGFLAAAGVRLAAGYARSIAILGGSFLLWLAWKSWREAPAEKATVATNEGLLPSVVTTFVLTLSNPMTILSFAAMIASTGVDAPVYFVTGVFLGSMLWWALLSTAATWLSSLIEVRGIVLNRMAAITLGSFGVWAIVGKGLR